MCRVSPALLRNYLAWLAFASRLVLLWVGISVNWFEWSERVAADLYWATRQEDPGYADFEILRDEADTIDNAWVQHELTDPDARRLCQELALRLHRWDDETDFEVGLFSTDFWESDDECLPFRSFFGRRGMFESEESAIGGSTFCNYLVFTF
jgi:hypothetical protein